ncbi:hypothetical protein [Streptomyces sp. CNQ085]|uniref:hypothetical protein n=1 Tax=Streptomyces sp. CNQ085 TaxID=2886944 RepID=UPI001F50D33B|nr:hypothetical protein [Streptomyces sp. CNQ085]MCI0386596.1 hypothetical protein [Streptomyces sp. CNQ085]
MLTTGTVTTGTVSGCGQDGRIHEVRITRELRPRRGAGEGRHLVCGTCDRRFTARGLARAEAAHHLAEHGARGGGGQRLSPAPWILGLIGLAGFLTVFTPAFLGH